MTQKTREQKEAKMPYNKENSNGGVNSGKNVRYTVQVAEPDNTVFYQTYGKDTRFELKNNGFGIERVNVNFQKLKKVNGATKQDALIPIYLKFDEARVLIFDYEHGNIAKKWAADKAAADKAAAAGQTYYAKPLFATRGGTSAERLQAQGRARPDGNAEYRAMTIIRGNRTPYVLVGTVSAGVTDEEGKINPKKGEDGKVIDSRSIMIGISAAQMKAIILAIKDEILAYRTAQLTLAATKPMNEIILNTVKNALQAVSTNLSHKMIEVFKGLSKVEPEPAEKAPTQNNVIDDDVPDVKNIKGAVVDTSADAAPAVKEVTSVGDDVFEIDDSDLPF
jgi:hypothetical protein